MRHFYSTSDWTRGELEELLALARRYRTDPYRKDLADRSLAMVFFNPSLRTRTSFELAIAHLGGHGVVLEVGQGTWKLEYADGAVMDGEEAEHVADAVRTLARYAGAVAVRSFPRRGDWALERTDPLLSSFMRHSPVPVINMESCLWHPCQALADILTIADTFGGTDGVPVTMTWAYHPRALPTAVPNSFALIAAQFGVDLTIAAPRGFDLDPDVTARLGAFRRVETMEEGLRGAEVVYAKSWGSLDHFGDEAAERALREPLRGWQVRAAKRFMHCLPVRRNVVVADHVIDGPGSLVYDQAANRLHVQKAVLARLMSSGPI